MDENEKLQENAEHYAEARVVAEAFYFRYVRQSSPNAAIASIAELIHYGEADLDLIRQRIVL